MPSASTNHSLDPKETIWNHPSVTALAKGANPFQAVVSIARETAFRAFQSGWSGPPYDPFALAEILRIPVEPRQDVVDARTVPASGGKFKIEFNPDRSRARINFSIAHEIVHTLFPDCAQAIRNRSTHFETKPNDWQLEVLCNVGAAEILMPTGSFRPSDDTALSIDAAMELRRQYSVSSEAVLLRIARLTNRKCFVFSAHREEAKSPSVYRLDYAVPSRAWPITLPTGFQIPSNTVIAQCTAIGFTAKADEEWLTGRGRWSIECLGISPYPGHTYPRVVGIAKPADNHVAPHVSIQYLKGDAMDPRGMGTKVIVQVVNDKAITWGRGFSSSVRKRWPQAQKNFTQWVFGNRDEFKLGSVHFERLDNSLELASLVAQHGYGPSLFPRIQYSALERCLSKVAARAREENASVHMPRIGCGEAGGDWKIVSEIIDESICRDNIPVTVYDLPEGFPHTADRACVPSTGN